MQNQMEQFAQTLNVWVLPQLLALAPEARRLTLESFLNGFVRLALDARTPPSEVAAMLRALADTIDPR